ncbi:MAG: hypothetical protein M9962_06925 [Oligoflexia bacterium]|nr:hypothetical protein [Oligoflexia bacterium]
MNRFHLERRGKQVALICSMLSFVLSPSAFGMVLEIDTIPMAQASSPPCSSPSSYFEFQTFPNKTGPYMAANCQSGCQMAAQQEPANANSILAQAKAQNAQINATNATGSNGLQAATANNQLDPQQKVDSLNSLGNNSASQQAQLATAVSQAMRQCAQNIRNQCQSGVDSQDTQIGEQAAKSCEDAANKADQVAADKMAKAGEMGQNGNQAGQNGQGMGMPQMPQGGGAEPVSSDPAKGSTVNQTSGGNSNLQADNANGTSFGDSIDSNQSTITPGEFNSSGSNSVAGGDQNIGSRNPTSAGSDDASGAGSSTGYSGSSGSTGATSAQSAMPGSGDALAKEEAALNGLEVKAGDEAVAPTAGGVKPAFIGLNNNASPTDILGLTANEAGSAGASKDKLSGQSGKFGSGPLAQSANDPMLDFSLFHRIKSKLTTISKEMHMQ